MVVVMVKLESICVAHLCVQKRARVLQALLPLLAASRCQEKQVRRVNGLGGWST